ncbi:ribosomal oxygenase 1 [Anabrus simplex]|uniref:ribosomal oxygenase 1 n=1 Tax=Anabrus simplex TaxID=316456 RepID=UPI0035A35B1F
MAPITSAFAVYQRKRLQRLKKRTRKGKPQVKNISKRPVPSTSNTEDWDTDQDTIIIQNNNSQEGTSNNFKKDSTEIAGGSKYKKDANHQDVDWGSDHPTEIFEKSANEEFRAPINTAKRKVKAVATSSGLQSQRRQETQPSLLRKMRAEAEAKKRRRSDRTSMPYEESESGSDNAEQEVESEDDEENKIADPSKDPNIPDSIKEGEELFAWMISPITQNSFFETAWEMKPMHVRRRPTPNYYCDLVTTKMIDNALSKNYLAYGRNVDITLYANGKRKTLNPQGRATRKEVWDFYNKGCSVRLLNPQSYFPGLGVLLATLQEYFCSYVGANIYLTPPDSQGFAPHYDDIEAFVLQVEGKKQWKLYKPRPGEELPRESSKDYRPEDLQEDPAMDLILNEGEMLYFPRGWIHQAYTVPGYKSLHITVSCYQHQSWIDLFEKLMPAALQSASEDIEFRRGLPLGYLHAMGVAHSDLNTPIRNSFLADYTYLSKRFMKFFQVDAAIDQIGRQFMHDALPPMLGSEEMSRSIYGEKLVEANDGKILVGRKLNKDMKIKLMRASVLRLVSEDDTSDKVQLYHSGKNSLIYHEGEEHRLEVDVDEALMVEYLLHVYPRYTAIRNLPTAKVAVMRKVALATLLYNHGTLLVSK